MLIAEAKAEATAEKTRNPRDSKSRGFFYRAGLKLKTLFSDSQQPWKADANASADGESCEGHDACSLKSVFNFNPAQ